MQNYLTVGDDSLRMEVIHEEDESNAAKMSFQQLDALRFELTANVEHDCKLLRTALGKLQKSVQMRAINRQLARFQFEQLKEKLDKFFAQKIEVKSEIQLETLSYLCNDINVLMQSINENYEEQSGIFQDSRYDLSSSQIDVLMKKKNSEQISQIHKKSFGKVNQSIDSDQQLQNNNSHRRNPSASSLIQNNNGHINHQNNLSQMNVKYSQSRFQSSENISFNPTSGNVNIGYQIQINSQDQIVFPLRQKTISSSPVKQADQDNYNLDMSGIDEISVGESNTFIQYEDTIINIPKSIEIKPNSFNAFKNQSQINENTSSSQSGIIPQNSIITPKYSDTSFKNNGNPQIKKDIQKNETSSAININDNNPNNQFKTPQKQNGDGLLKMDTLQVIDEKQSFNSKNSNTNIKSNSGMQLLTLQEQDLHLKSTNGPEDEEEGFEHMKSFQSSNNQKQDTKQTPKEKNVIDIKEIQKSLEGDYDKIKQLFDDKYLDQVEEERIKLYSKIEDLKKKNYSPKNEFNQMLSNFENKIQKELQYYSQLYKQLITTTNYIQEKDGWKQEKNKDGMQIEYKKLPDSKLIALKLECDDMEMSIKVLISIVYEIDLYSLWFPFCKVGKNLKTIDKACKVVYLKMDPPFVSDREVYVYGLGVNRLYKDGSIVVMARSIDKDEQFQKELGVEVPPTSKCVRVDMPFFTFVFKPINEQRLQMYAVCQLDPHLKAVPDSLINLVTRKFAYFLFEKMLEQNKKFKGSKWEQNMKNNPEFYNWIEREYQQFFERNPQLREQFEQSHQSGKNKKKK